MKHWHMLKQGWPNQFRKSLFLKKEAGTPLMQRKLGEYFNGARVQNVVSYSLTTSVNLFLIWRLIYWVTEFTYTVVHYMHKFIHLNPYHAWDSNSFYCSNEHKLSTYIHFSMEDELTHGKFLIEIIKRGPSWEFSNWELSVFRETRGSICDETSEADQSEKQNITSTLQV